MYFSLLSYFISFKICLFCLKLEKLLKSQKYVGPLTYFRRRSGNMVITLFKPRCYVQEHRSLVTKRDSLGSRYVITKVFDKKKVEKLIPITVFLIILMINKLYFTFYTDSVYNNIIIMVIK